jgi:hypothetical protein
MAAVAARSLLRLVPFVLAAALVATLAAPAMAQSGELKRFITPSRNIGCFGDSTGVRCDIRTTSAKPPKKPANCRLDWGSAYEVNRIGRGHGLCVGDTALPDPNKREPVLKYGHTIRLGKKLRCTSKRTGLTCRNGAGHGFTLSKTVIRLF